MEILNAVKAIVESTGLCKTVKLKQTDWRTESEYPVCYILMPMQSFDTKGITGYDLNSLKGSAMVSIRVVTENTDDTPEAELDTILEAIMQELVKDTRLKNTVKTSNIIQTQTDGGVIVTHSVGQIDLQVLI